MQELKEKLDALEAKLLKEIKEISDDNSDVWESMDKLADAIIILTKNFKELRTDVDKLIENNQGGRMSA